MLRNFTICYGYELTPKAHVLKTWSLAGRAFKRHLDHKKPSLIL
jgi:hypothetical protein